MSVLEHRKGLYCCGQLWGVHVFLGTHPPSAPETEHFRKMWMGVAVPAIKAFRGGRGKNRAGNISPLGTVEGLIRCHGARGHGARWHGASGLVRGDWESRE